MLRVICGEPILPYVMGVLQLFLSHLRHAGASLSHLCRIFVVSLSYLCHIFVISLSYLGVSLSVSLSGATCPRNPWPVWHWPIWSAHFGPWPKLPRKMRARNIFDNFWSKIDQKMTKFDQAGMSKFWGVLFFWK